MAWSADDGDQTDQEIFDAMAEFLGQLLAQGEALAGEFGMPMFCLKALHRLDTPISMKELGQRMRCDRSFVTMIADTLEGRGLARRAPDTADRRIKNLVLTADGLALKARVERAILSHMPWSSALDPTEKARLLELVRTMSRAAEAAGAPSPDERAGEVSDTDGAASRGSP